MSTSNFFLRALPARESAIDETKNASSTMAVPIEPAANVSVPTTNAATAPLIVRAFERTAASAISSAVSAPIPRSCAFRR
jgi:hypothetical protein